jgi:FkbM family methyltransferase
MSGISKIAKSLHSHFLLFGVKGVVRRAAIGLTGSSAIFRAPLAGTNKSALIRLGTTDVAAYEHVFIAHEYGFRLRQASIIIDVGANVGMSAVYFCQQYPEARIIAVEPEPDTFAILSKNAELFPQITPIHAGLWNQDGFVGMRDAGAGYWGMQVHASVVPSDASVPSVRLATLIAEYGIKKIDLLKIDAEGAEIEILEEYKRWIDLVQVICCELHDRLKPGCSQAFERATTNFPLKWRRGELFCAARDGAVLEK